MKLTALHLWYFKPKKRKKIYVQDQYYSLAHLYSLILKEEWEEYFRIFFDFPSEMSCRKENVLKSNMAGYVLMCTLAVDNK